MLVLTWLVFAGLATAAGFAAVGLVGQGLDLTASPTSGPTSTASAGSPSPTATPSTTAEPTTTEPATSPAVRRTASRSIRGNFVSASCRGASVTLSASPAQGWRLDDYRPGPAREARAKFRSDSAEVELKVSCSGGRPVFEAKADSDSGHEED